MSQTPQDARLMLEGQLRECYGRVVYSHKTHEKCADLVLKVNGRLKICQIVLSALSTSGFFVAAFGEVRWVVIVGLVISLALLVLNTYTKDYDLGTIAQKHRDAGSDLWIIREEYLSLLTDLKMGVESLDSIIKRRDELLPKLQAVYKGAPSTNFKAYSEAQKALKQSEDMTFSDREIDAFLPSELKRIEKP